VGFYPFTPAAVAPAVVALTDAATIALNAQLGNVFTITLAGNRTLASPAGPSNGQHILVIVTQDATGSRTLSYGAAYNFGAAGAPTLTTTAGDWDILGFVYVGAQSAWCFAGSALGF
jgi:hypothetical protein